MHPLRPHPLASPLRLGLAGAVTVFATLAVLHAVTIPPFLPADELAHYGYASSLGAGRLPTVDTAIPGSQATEVLVRLVADPDPNKSDVWVANHPPLFAALAALPVALGEATDHAVTGLLVARLISAMAGAAAVALTGALALVLLPRRPRVAVLAAGLLATIPLVAHVSGFAYNDALAMAAVSASILGGAAALRHRPGRVRASASEPGGWGSKRVRASASEPGGWGSKQVTAAVTVAAAAAALTRASALPAAAFAVAALAYAGARRVEGPGPRLAERLVAAVRAAWIPALAVTIAAGWFYVRNVALYGGPTAAVYLFDKFERSPRPEGRAILLDPGFWRVQIQDYWRGFADSKGVLGDDWLTWIWAAAAVMIVGLCVGAVRLGGADRRPGDRLAPWVPALAYVAVLVWSISSFVAGGGSPHPRYWMGALPVVAVVVAAGLDALPGRRWAVVPAGLLSLQVGLGVRAWYEYMGSRYLIADPSPSWWGQATGVLDAAGAPLPALSLAAVLVLLAIGLTAMLIGLRRTDDAAVAAWGDAGDHPIRSPAPVEPAGA
jgi:hypothetical protein